MANRVARTLRSRKLAIGLIVAVTLLSIVGTVAPQGQPTNPDVARWLAENPQLVPLAKALQLNTFYSSPLFLLVLAALTVSLAACSWERTGRAMRLYRGQGLVTPGDARRLRERPDLEITSDLDSDQAGDRVEEALRSSGYSVRRGPVVSSATRGTWALIGSPLFHWSLVALLVVVGFGRLTRYEGLLGVAVGQTVAVQPQAFGKLYVGPLAVAPGGYEINVESFDADFRANDITYGPTPLVHISRGGRRVASGQVRANAPLSAGALLVHANEYGLASKWTLLNADGTRAGETFLLHDFDDSTPSGVTSGDLMFGVEGSQTAAVVDVYARDRVGALPRLVPPRPVALIQFMTDAGASSAVTVTPGTSLDLADGSTLRLDDVDFYARLSVVNDWSVLPMYWLFLFALVGNCIALFVPYRSVLVAISAREDGGSRVTAVMATRRDPEGLREVERALQLAQSDQL